MRKLALSAFVTACVLALAAAWLAAPCPSQAAPKVYRVEARTTTFGGSSYILGFGMCDIINKHSSWVRGSVLESSGTPENVKIVGMSPGKRSRTFFTCSAEMYEKAKKGEAPFNQDSSKFKDLMIMSYQQSLAVSIITLDPKIKTLADLKGKRVATWPKGTTKFAMTYNLIGGAGKEVLDSIKWQYTAYAGYNDMILGKTDAALAFCPERGNDVYTTVPKLKELMSKRDVYFITATPAMRKLSGKLYGDMYGATATLKKGVLGNGVPRQNVLCFNIVLAWAVYPEMPADVVYEILKVTTEYAKDLKTYHSSGKGWIPEKFGAYPAPKKDWHPGAVKFYQEHKIPFGLEYFNKLYPSE
ncbi:MAG: TAXI family TRAP transporter solute-binding subunit [Desulfarculus sp.]|nr:TAXI family TRAP transporter solute-binding subunit [Pseudomonadota bacterium]MBV1716681.1 TAXI family TRAP transporter solute-binding subunit [Desulfarculus sp.]MBU4576254.1 TAXI family TRAP transporter solute-binding subunit [Pseudomonadota bacterium]MBU4597016.1 TAXI family TRAP transporter solute-binding subunit [Pseudomonadota bacterium]MBV1739805.1 TAXI family TRAP transporter solute-binding subunit [Desulfarculus sp.]